MLLLSNSSGNRRRAVLLPLGLLMLSMAVFGWGLQYKLSLYQGKGSIAHLTPEAKLLSQKERPRPAGGPLPQVRPRRFPGFCWSSSWASGLCRSPRDMFEQGAGRVRAPRRLALRLFSSALLLH